MARRCSICNKYCKSRHLSGGKCFDCLKKEKQSHKKGDKVENSLLPGIGNAICQICGKGGASECCSICYECYTGQCKEREKQLLKDRGVKELKELYKYGGQPLMVCPECGTDIDCSGHCELCWEDGIDTDELLLICECGWVQPCSICGRVMG